MNFLSDSVLDSSNTPSSSSAAVGNAPSNAYSDPYMTSPVLKCVSPRALMTSQSMDFSSQFDSTYFPQPMPIPQQSQQPQEQSLFGTSPPPELYEDLGDDDMMVDDFPLSSAQIPKFPFKPSSPYYHSPTIHSDPAFFNSMFPLTVSPQDSVLKHDDDYPMEASLQGLKEPSKFYLQDYTNFGQQLEEFEEPEAMDEDEDDEDNEYDEVLISSSDDELELEDDLYAPLSSSSKVPGLTSFGTQPPTITLDNHNTDFDTSIDYNNYNSRVPHTPEILHVPSLSVETPVTPINHSHISHIESTPSPKHSDNSHRRAPSGDGDSILKSRKRTPVSHTGPHRCDIVNPTTGKSCNKIFSRPYDLIRHQDTIHAPVRKTFKCEACGEASKTFSRMDALSRHIRVKHSKA